VIAHTLKRSVSRPLVLNDMQGSNVITNYVDNIFCIGQNRQESNERYVKHIKLRSTKRFCGAEHVPVFRLKKIGGNFLGFAFQRFEPESEMLRDGTDGNLWRTIQTVKNLSDSGMSIRNIAEQLDLSKSAAHRYLQMWQAQPEVPRPLTYEEIHGPTIDDGWRPPEEEYPGQRSDQYLIKIGLRPVCKERWEAEQAALNAANQSEPEDVATGELFVNSVYSVVESYAAKETTEDTEHTENPLDRMKLVIDDHGKELFVESEYENGKPKIWYQYRSDGALRRWEHNGDCVNESAADPEVFGQVRQAVFELTTEDTESTEIF